MRCNFCSSETKRIKSEKYQYTLSGLNNLFLKNIDLERCSKCELDIPVIPKIIRLHNTIANAIVCKKSFLLGEEIRFLRKNLLIKAQDWAKLLRKDVATISRAERDGNVLNKDLDLLIRLLYVRIWEETSGNIFGEKITGMLTTIDHTELNILIDVENIDDFSYIEMEEQWDDEITLNRSVYEATIDFGKKAIFKELGDSTLKQTSPFNINNYAENNELALAA